jgi:PAS domain S-box-containing protein
VAGFLPTSSSMMKRIRSYAQLVSRLLGARSQQEREKRAAHAFALLLVSAVAIGKYVTGATVDSAPFTVYTVAIAASAARGGFAPALVALLASILAGGLVSSPPPETLTRLLFTAEGLSVALVVSAVRARLQASRAGLGEAETTIADLRERDRHGRLLDAALEHLEDISGETAVAVLNESGIIVEWRAGAERLYGDSAEDLVGRSAASLFFETPSPAELSALLRQSEERGTLRRSDVHRRRDGVRLDVELEIRPFRNLDARGFTLAVQNMARRIEWDDYRKAAAQAQAALQHAADETKQRLAALERLTDPSLNPLGGTAMVTELLERLRATIGADGAALVQPGRTSGGVVAACGLEPTAGPAGQERLPLAPGRVAVVHNDPALVGQLSALGWPADVRSLLVVPVVHDGRVWSAIEVVSERSRRMNDWDVALARIVADRLAAVVVQQRGFGAKVS